MNTSITTHQLIKVFFVIVFSCFSFSGTVFGFTILDEHVKITGVVYHDKSKTGVFDPSTDIPLEGIAVSNGRDIVLTDNQGRYHLELRKNTSVFVIKPQNWQVAIDSLQIPRFYYMHFPEGATGERFAGLPATPPLPESLDFALYPHNEPDEFDVIVFADTQSRNEQELYYLTRDAVDDLIGTDAAFGVTLGDLVFDDLDLFEPLNQIMSTIGIPWYHMIGNHDLDFSADDNYGARGKYFNHYGPSYYSFEYGPAHFIVMDNIRFVIDGANRYYRPEMSADHLVFLENELARLDKDKLLILMMHIPWDDRGWNRQQRDRLAELLAPFSNTLSLGAHWHRHYHRFLGEDYGFTTDDPHHMISIGAVCGAWWRGFPDEYGIPHAVMSDGTPAGYGILKIADNMAKLHWQSSRRSADFQMHANVPGKINSNQTNGFLVSANVFNAMPDAKVQMRIGDNGQWIEMQKVVEPDPVQRGMIRQESALREQCDDLPGLEMRGAANSYKLWQAEIPYDLNPGSYVVHIRSEDRWWTHETRKVMRVVP